MDNEAEIRIVANAAGVAPGVEQATGEIEGLGATLKALTAGFAQLATEIRASMASGTKGTAEMATEMKLLEEETKRETLSLREMAMSVHEGVESFNGFKMGLAEIAEVWMAAFAVEQIADWAKEFAEASEKVKHLREEFGLTTSQVQQLNTLAALTGMSVDTLVRGMGLLDRNLFLGNKGAASTLKQMGIDAKNSKDQMELLAKVADKFHDMDNGPKKAALAMQLFGRAGKELIPILNQGGEAFRAAKEKGEEYGAVSQHNGDLADRAQKSGEALAESINETKVAWQGLTNVLGDAFGPILKDATDSLNHLIKAFVDSYTQGGIVAIMFQAIKNQIEVVGTEIDLVAGVFEAAWNAISEIVGDLASAVADAFGIKMPEDFKSAEVALNEFKDFFAFVKDVIILVIDLIKAAVITLVDSLVMFAKIAWDSFTMNWGAITADWEKGLAKIDADSRKTANDIRADWASVGDDIANALAGKGPKGDEKKKGDGTPTPGTFDPTLHSGGGGHKKEGPSIVEKWRADLAEALNMEENWGVDETAFTLKFWQDKLALVKKGSKEEIEIRKEVAKDKKALFREEQQDELRVIKQTQDSAVDAVKSTADLDKAEIDRQLANLDYKEKNNQITAVKAAQTRRDLMTTLYAIEADEVNKEYTLKRKALVDELALAHLKPAQVKAINDQILALDRQHNAAVLLNEKQTGQKLVALDREVVQARRAQFQNIAQAWGQEIGKMLTFQQSFWQTVGNGYMALVHVVENAIAKMVEAWLLALLTKETAEEKAHLKEIIREAKGAAAKAYHAVVGIPVVGPILAPIAAAAAFAAVTAFSAKDGDWNVSEGLYHLHEKEMVLPAHLASPLRSMIEGGGANDNSAWSGGRGAAAQGDTHHHTANYYINAMDGRSVKRVLMNNPDAMAAGTQEAHRRGHFAGMKRA
jgi:hypothetical protein